MDAILVWLYSLEGVPVETAQALADRRLVVEQGCDPQAYEALALAYAKAGQINAANRLLARGLHYRSLQGAQPCQA